MVQAVKDNASTKATGADAVTATTSAPPPQSSSFPTLSPLSAGSAAGEANIIDKHGVAPVHVAAGVASCAVSRDKWSGKSGGCSDIMRVRLQKVAACFRSKEESQWS